MIEKNQIRTSFDGKEKIIILDKKQDHNGFSYLIKTIGAEPCWVSTTTIEHYWPLAKERL